MSIQSNLPQIVALRQKVEERFGKPLAVHADFIALADQIEKKLREHISESTLERVWGYSTRGYDSVSLRTLDVLSLYATDGFWVEFCEHLRQEAGTESELFDAEVINVSELSEGQELLIGWLPNRMCRIRYDGNNAFTALECEHSKMQPGDTFCVQQFILGKELVMTNFRTQGSLEHRNYVVGQKNGLTVLRVL
jgi:hypothetical protein